MFPDNHGIWSGRNEISISMEFPIHFNKHDPKNYILFQTMYMFEDEGQSWE